MMNEHCIIKDYKLFFLLSSLSSAVSAYHPRLNNKAQEQLRIDRLIAANRSNQVCCMVFPATSRREQREGEIYAIEKTERNEGRDRDGNGWDHGAVFQTWTILFRSSSRLSNQPT